MDIFQNNVIEECKRITMHMIDDNDELQKRLEEKQSKFIKTQRKIIEKNPEKFEKIIFGRKINEDGIVQKSFFEEILSTSETAWLINFIWRQFDLFRKPFILNLVSLLITFSTFFEIFIVKM